jgi:carboxyl-terminal processing protease
LSDALNGRFQVPVGRSVAAQFRDGQDQVVEKTMTSVPPPGRKVQFGHLPEGYVHIDVKKLEPNIGYVTFNYFLAPPYVMARFNDAMLEFMDADGIIIDIRGNGGGMGDIAVGMIGWLIGDKDEVLGKILIRDLDLKMIAKPRPKRYTGPVVLLIDELSVSAAEFMASGVKDTGCGYLIGTRTAGAVLGSRVERLPNGDGFQYAAVNFLSAKTGKMLEGVGVPPDLEVQPSRAALLEGGDPVLAAAVHWIQNKGREGVKR